MPLAHISYLLGASSPTQINEDAVLRHIHATLSTATAGAAARLQQECATRSRAAERLKRQRQQEQEQQQKQQALQEQQQARRAAACKEFSKIQSANNYDQVLSIEKVRRPDALPSMIGHAFPGQ